MIPKIRNIIIFVIIVAVLVLIYIFFIKSSPDQGSLVSSSNTSLPNVNNSSTGTSSSTGGPLVAEDFLTLLLNVKNIKLDDTIFSDPTFNSLHDSSIVLTPDTDIGRPNPFAPFGADNVALPANVPSAN